MRKELKDFLKSDDMVLYLPRDYSKDMISQWMTCRNIFRAPLNWLLISFSKIIPSSSWTSSFYRLFLGMKIGKGVGFAQISPDYIMPEAIEIDDFSAFGWKVAIFTHEFTQHHQRFGKVKVGKNVLVGGFSILRSGIRIGNNSIISPNSFVICDVPTNELWGGNPAKKLKDLDTHHISPDWVTYKKRNLNSQKLKKHSNEESGTFLT